MVRIRQISAIILLAMCAFSLHAQKYEMKGEVKDLFDKGELEFRQHKYEDAVKHFKDADKRADHQCVECLYSLEKAYYTLQAYKNVIETSDRTLALLPDHQSPYIPVRYFKCLALTDWAIEKKEKLVEAEVELRALVAEVPIHYGARLKLDTVLIREGKMDEAKMDLKAYMEDPKITQPLRDSARKLYENPWRANPMFIPDFSMTTRDGEFVDSDDLRGKVVLLDFWATWCGPCRAALSDIKDLYKHRKKDNVVFISISADHDKEAWNAFIEKNSMEWMQYFDGESKVQRAFGVYAFPSYFIFDPNGVLVHKEVGAGMFSGSKIDDDIRKALKTSYSPDAKDGVMIKR